MAISIKDIARAAGVSHSTVSRALTDSPLVQDQTKERIRRLAQEMGYTPSAIARSLVRQRTDTIGVVVSTVADPFVSEVVRGIEETAFNASFSILLCESGNDRDREMAAVKMLREKRVDGIVVSASHVGDFYMPLLDELVMPIVLVNREQGTRYAYSVVTDDIHGGELATRYLLTLGHRRIGLIAGPSISQSSSNRLSAYRRTLESQRITFDPSLIVPGDGTASGGRAGVDLLCSSRQPPTAIFCYNDMTAIGAIASLKKHGLSVPGDVSVVGFDDIAFAEYVDPPLTTVRQRKYDMGRLAIEMVLDLLNGKDPEANVYLRGEMVVRESCRALRNPVISNQEHEMEVK
jgi:DNA-binding LacI/PurR family transcriptional regulator